MKRLVLALYVLFFISGLAGLIYESVWSRYLGLFVGHGAYAQVIVLVIFLGGMSAGAMYAGKRSKRIANPLFAYAVIEGAVGVIGIAFHSVYGVVTDVAYDSVFPALSGGVGLSIAKWGIAALLVLPQSLLLGATFPLMSAAALRLSREEPGRTISLLYFTNSLGAAIGVLLAGFYFVGLVGLPGTLMVAGALNLVVAAIAIAINRQVVRDARDDVERPLEEKPAEDMSATLKLMLVVAFGTALASFIYEIAWIRMLALALGSATHCFELMLSAFILGLALGSFWIRRRADRVADPMRMLGIVQWTMGFLALATLPLYLRSFDATATLLETFARSNTGYTSFTVARYGLCLAIMLPATFCAGITLPLIIRVLLAKGVGERAIGAVYGWNTLGSICGVVLASLVLLPLVGLEWLLVLGATVDMALGAYILSRGKHKRLAIAAVGATAILALAVGATQRLSYDVATSGVFRTGKVKRDLGRDYLHYADGRTATVAAYRSRQGTISLLTNGKPDASIDPEWFEPCGKGPLRAMQNDSSTQVLLPLVLLAHAPHARQAAVIGQGSGMSSHLLLASPAIEHAVTIEIEPEMIAASRVLYPLNRRVFDDPRSELVIDDAKAYFAATDRRFDLILSEPSNPVVSGVSGLFSVEFYNRIRTYLTDDGVFGQWLHLYELDDELLLNVLAAIHQSFPSYAIFVNSATDVLIVAGTKPVLTAPDWSAIRSPELERDLCRFVPFGAEHFEATRAIERAALAPLLDRSIVANSDFFPILDLGSERARYLHTEATGLSKLTTDRFVFAAAMANRRIPLATSDATPVLTIPRLVALAVGASLRSDTRPAIRGPLDGLRDDRMFRVRAWKQSLDATAPPVDWRLWTQQALGVEELLHAGTAGVVDETFFQLANAFADKHAAPAPVRAAIRFRHGVGTWSWPEVREAAPKLFGPALAGAHFIPPDELRAGIVMALVDAGAVDDARVAFERLEPFSQLAPTDLRVLLLVAWISK
jgi:spermidine synthase